MKKLFTLIAFAFATLCAMAQTPAFPGAEGHGRYVTGGRGGNIIHVTNLNDSGTGSLRAAVSGTTKKIIVFDVAGVIALTKDLTIGDNTTIMGQTAPSPGITLRYYTVQPGNNNIIRFIRFRRGQEKNVNDGADATWQRNKTGIIFDHCSFSWSIDEVASFYDNNNFTMQWCTISESLTNPGHSKGAHGYGGIWGGKLASFHHNMIAHVSNRGPRFNGARYEWNGYTTNYDYAKYKWANHVQAENVDFRNCVMYNAQGTCYGGPGGGQINMVNNYYKSGPRGSHKNTVTLVTVGAEGNSSGHPNAYDMTSRYYIKGNTTATKDGVETKNTDWAGVSYDSGTLSQNGERYSKDKNNYYPADVPSVTSGGVRYVRIKMDEPAPTGNITTHSASDAFTKVLEYVGASLDRDEVDARNVKEATEGNATYKGSVTGTWGLIDLVADVNGYTEANFGKASRPAGFDADKDGIADEWEKQYGLDPTDPADAKKYTLDPEGKYTNIELYCNSLVEDIMKGGMEDGESNYEEYWPVPTKPVPSVKGEPVTITLDASTNTGKNSSSSYEFSDNDYTVTITNTKSKGYAKGSENYIKYSAGTQYTINLPKDVTVSEVVLKGYDNYGDADAYISELNGQTYGASDYVFTKKTSDGAAIICTNTVKTDASGTLTFTPAGKQVVLSIQLNGNLPGSTGIEDVKTPTLSRDNNIYNVCGQRVSGNTKGIVIKNGKKFIVK